MWSAIGGPAIISGITLAVFTAVLTFFFNRKDRKDEVRAESQQTREILMIKNIQAVGHLAEATAIGLKEQHFDGNIDTAVGYYRQARDDMNEFLIKQGAAANH